jgi:hypothetical protein
MFINQTYLLLFFILFMSKFLWGKLLNGLIMFLSNNPSFPLSLKQGAALAKIRDEQASMTCKRTKIHCGRKSEFGFIISNEFLIFIVQIFLYHVIYSEKPKLLI